MNRVLKRLASVGVASLLVVAGLLPLTHAYAEQKGSGDYKATVSVDSNIDWVASLTINGDEWSEEDSYLDSDGDYFITIELHVPNEDLRANTSVRAGGGTNFEIQQAGAEEELDGYRKFTYTAHYYPETSELVTHLSLNPYSEDQQPGPGPEPQGDTTATLRIRGGEGYFIDGEHTVYYTDTYQEGSYLINNSWPVQPMPEDAVPETNYSEIEIHYDDDPEVDTVTLGFETLWHMRYVDTITINNVNYNIPVNYDDQFSYLTHYNQQMVSFRIDVPKANDNIYDIVVKIGRSEHVWIGNFLWTSDPEQMYEKDCHFDEESGKDVCEIRYDEEGNPIPGRDYIGNSSLNLIALKYTVGNETDGYMTYTCDRDLGTCTWWASDANGEILPETEALECSLEDVENCGIPYLEFESRAGEDAEFDDGSLVAPAGATVTMEVIPDYGYQVMNVNMADLVVSDDGVGRFTFTIPDGAAYFVADVVPMEDVVNSTTDKVVDGAIDLGDGQTTLSHGTAKLEVGDVELDDDTIAGFEGAADGYNVKNYLEISLYNITCKGAEVCEGTDDDSWIDQIKDLNEPATITLQLEEGVDGNEIVIVHQKHDGTYEIIPTAYDPETHTITFSCTSFSNYAIASRTVAPDTGVFSKNGGFVTIAVEIMAFVAAIITSGVIARVAIKRNK